MDSGSRKALRMEIAVEKAMNRMRKEPWETKAMAVPTAVSGGLTVGRRGRGNYTGNGGTQGTATTHPLAVFTPSAGSQLVVCVWFGFGFPFSITAARKAYVHGCGC